MEGDRAKRRLAAIVAADVAGFSRLVGADEEGTLARLKALRRELIDPKIAEHSGRIVKTTGDGLLLEFGSAVDAVRCVIDVQRSMSARESELPENKRIQFRIGVNVGDIVIDGDDILGDGVNVAARLEQLAEPGGVCISSRVYEDVRGRLDLEVQDIGEQQLRNIERAIRVYRVAVRAAGMMSLDPVLSLPDKPSIAVLPFQNMSGDPEQEYFSDGMAEEIITALSRFHSVFVIARNSSFIYKGKAVDVRQVARDLGVRYVLEGSVRKSGQMVRITGQLIDATTGKHLWADKFDGNLADVFELQDKVTVNVVTAIEPKIRVAEIERAKRKPAESQDAYDLYLRALSVHHGLSKEGLMEAVGLLYRATRIHPKYAAAHGLASISIISLGAQGWSEDRERDRAESLRLARLAIDSDRDDHEAMCWAAWSLAYHGADVDQAIYLLDRSLEQNPNYASAWMYSGGSRICVGDSDTAIHHLGQAQRLSPRDPNMFFLLGLAAFAHMYAGRLEDGVNYARRSIAERSQFTSSHRALAACYVLLGREAEARDVAKEILRLDPAYSVGRSRRAPTGMGRHPRAAIYYDALLAAGLPE